MRNRNGIPVVNTPDFPCGKVVYGSKAAAKVAVMDRGVETTQYFCHRCCGWHNTKKLRSAVRGLFRKTLT
ncbi:MAG: hypothetical protein JO043_00080 [Candidatus Eremiobacteraeota bacterium]|nr:hypothetical protein [Candidatus Eremiobacteraeota bacterium]